MSPSDPGPADRSPSTRARLAAAARAHDARAAVELIDHLAARHPDLTVLALGPLTNLAAYAEATGVARFDRLVVMGGAFAHSGNVTAWAEANIHNDPEAADVALSLGLSLRMIGLDVTHQTILTRDDTASWRELGTAAGRLYADMTDHYIGTYEQNNPHMGGCALHDPLAVAAAIDSLMITSWAPMTPRRSMARAGLLEMTPLCSSASAGR